MLSEKQRTEIRVLQYLSMLFLKGQEERSRVSSRQTAQALGLNSYDVEEIYQRLARARFVSLDASGPAGFPQIMDARLDQVLWDRNRSSASAFYAHYVANAPSSLRGPYSQRAMDATIGAPLVPSALRPSSCDAVVATNFDGVFNSYQTNTFSCPVQEIPPVETGLLRSESVDPKILVTENLIALQEYRLFLLGLYSFGAGGLSLAEWFDRGSGNARTSLYCLAESDAVLLSSATSLFTPNLARGGPVSGPRGSRFVLETHEGQAGYEVTPSAGGEGVLERAGLSVSYKLLGRAVNGTWILGINGRLP
jgi:hypothetical protein